MIEIFKEPFVQTGVIASVLLGGFCAYLGIFLVLKRIVFVGAALSQLAAVGIALGHLLGHWVEIKPGVMAFTFALAGAFIFWIPFSQKRLSKESWIGYVFAFAGSAAILFTAKDPLAEAEGLDLFAGNLLYLSGSDLYWLLGVITVMALIHFLFYKEFLFISFDADTARTLNIPASAYEFFLYLTLGATVAVGIKMCGLLFVFSSLIIPAVIALRLFNRMSLAIPVAVGSVLVASVAGMIASYHWDLPTAPTISVTNALLILPTLLIRR